MVADFHTYFSGNFQQIRILFRTQVEIKTCALLVRKKLLGSIMSASVTFTGITRIYIPSTHWGYCSKYVFSYFNSPKNESKNVRLRSVLLSGPIFLDVIARCLYMILRFAIVEKLCINLVSTLTHFALNFGWSAIPNIPCDPSFN